MLGLRMAPVEVVKIPDPPGNLCSQVSRFATAHIVLTIHGAHLMHSSFMTPGEAVLVEVMPYNNHNLQFTVVITQPIGIRYMKACGLKEEGMDECYPKIPLSDTRRIPCTLKHLDCWFTRTHTHDSDPTCTAASTRCTRASMGCSPEQLSIF